MEKSSSKVYVVKKRLKESLFFLGLIIWACGHLGPIFPHLSEPFNVQRVVDMFGSLLITRCQKVFLYATPLFPSRSLFVVNLYFHFCKCNNDRV